MKTWGVSQFHLWSLSSYQIKVCGYRLSFEKSHRQGCDGNLINASDAFLSISEAFKYSSNVLTWSQRHRAAMPQKLGGNGGRATERWRTTVEVSALIYLKIMNLKTATTTEMKLPQIKVSSAWRCQCAEVADLMFGFGLCSRRRGHNCQIPWLS